MKKLLEEQVAAELKKLPDWSREGDAIVRTFVRKTFMGSIGFVQKIAPLAEKADHHPDLDIRFDKVRVLLTTHSARGLTANDFSMAHQIDGAA